MMFLKNPLTSLDSKIPYFSELVKCGFPSPAADYKEEGLDFNELLVKRKSATYCLRVTGCSMEGRGISAGDILVVDRSLVPRDNDIIVASLDGNFTVKTYLRGPYNPVEKTNGKEDIRGIILRAAHPDYEDIVLAPGEELFCFGVVVHAIKTFRA